MSLSSRGDLGCRILGGQGSLALAAGNPFLCLAAQRRRSSKVCSPSVAIAEICELKNNAGKPEQPKSCMEKIPLNARRERR
jgi:hypothetical protein